MNDELSKASLTLIDAARRQGGPTSAQKARLTAAVLTTTATAAAAMATSVTATGTSLVKLVGAGFIATLVGASGTLLVKKAVESHRPALTVSAERVPRPAVAPALPRVVAPAARAPDPIPSVVEETELPVQPVREPPPPQVMPLPAAHPEAVPPAEPATADIPPPLPLMYATPVDTTPAEVTALGAALEALEEDRPKDALDLAHAMRLAAPRGALSPELTVVEVEALCRLQRQPEASALAASMPERDRSALVVQRLRRTCVAR
jgi:hypothetical protein